MQMLSNMRDQIQEVIVLFNPRFVETVRSTELPPKTSLALQSYLLVFRFLMKERGEHIYRTCAYVYIYISIYILQ